MKAKASGKLICIYGINNIGKSTQTRLLVSYLQEKLRNVVYLKYPIYATEPSGTYINKILRGSASQQISEEELQLWYTLNRFQNNAALRAMLEKGSVVVAEDYIGTGLAWGAAKGADAAWLAEMNKPLVHEDIAILLDGERFLAGKEAQHLHETNDVLMQRCRETHKILAAQYGWHTVNANQAEEQVAADIREIIDRFLTL